MLAGIRQYAVEQPPEECDPPQRRNRGRPKRRTSIERHV
jgi:hypothetical protein